MPIVFACAGSHAPGITAWTERAPKEQVDRFVGGYRSMQEGLEKAQPDTILLLTSEHWANFFLDHVGAFCVGRGETFEGPLEPWLRVEKSWLPGSPSFASRLLEHCYAHDFELNFSDELKLDHGSMVPLSFLMPKMDRKIVPLMFNTLMPPRPTARRCLELGKVLRGFLETCDERVAVVATGGLSHDPGEVNHGFIDRAFDEGFLKAITDGDMERLGAYKDAELLKAGAGTLELLAWICLAGVMNGQKSRVVSYEAVEPWATGVGIIAYDQAA